jgi:anti-sigma regulatory factor (Ser/Thr protein kinase)
VETKHSHDKETARSLLSVRVANESVCEIEDFVATFAAEQGIASEDKARVLILVEELFTNLSRYGYPDQPQPAGEAEVVLELDEDRLTIEFRDDGREFNPLADAPAALEVRDDEAPAGGLGLHIVRELADGADYVRADGRNVIRLNRRVSLARGPRRSDRAAAGTRRTN